MENVINLAVITLLVIAIIYAMILNHRLSAFKDGKKEVMNTIRSFNLVVENAETTLSQLQKSTQNIAEQLKEEIKKANLLRDDLILILDKNAHTQYSTHTQTQSPSFAYKKSTELKQGTFTKLPHETVNLYQSDAEKELYMALQRLKGES